MATKFIFTMHLVMLLAPVLTACSNQTNFVAPEIDPPADLIPSYVPEGFELGFGFQLPGEVPMSPISDGDGVSHLIRSRIFNLKTPRGNDVQGVYYQGKDHLILITKSYFPEGTLNIWKNTYEASWPKPCECECIELRLDDISLPPRSHQIQEERTIDGVPVAILKGMQGWTTVFVRGDYLLTVESGISLEENLKVVASLLSE